MTETFAASRGEAVQNGLTMYQGKPCPHGHSGVRFVSNSGCVECLRGYCKKYHEKNRDGRLEYMRQLAKTDVEGNRRRSRDWRAKQPESVRREIVRRNYEKRRDQAIAYSRKWAKENPERVRAHRKNKRARRRGAIGDDRVSANEWERIKKEAGFRCLACDRPEPTIQLTQDHVVPLSRGGRHLAENIQPLCLDCNKRKAAKTIDFREVGS